MKPCVDIAINIYGKPYQTAVTLFSLLKYSGKHIDKIYFIQEKKQPYDVKISDFYFIKKILQLRIIDFVPKFYLSTFPLLKIFFPLFSFTSFRHSVRYQYAWENTDKKYLFITHNDVLYTKDIIGYFIDNIGSNIGIGDIGQCWNCPASFSGMCDGKNYQSYRPTYNEYMELIKKFPPPRRNFEAIKRTEPVWPLPECRINEWMCMINMELARPVTIPLGKATPFGLLRQDTGTRWFNEIHKEGFLAKNTELSEYATHLSGGGGNSVLSDQSKYLAAEQIAKSLLEKEYPDILTQDITGVVNG